MFRHIDVVVFISSFVSQDNIELFSLKAIVSAK